MSTSVPTMDEILALQMLAMEALLHRGFSLDDACGACNAGDPDEYEVLDDGRVGLVEDGFFADYSGTHTIQFPTAETASDAANEYVSDGDWGDPPAGTDWIAIDTWREARAANEDGCLETVLLDEESHLVPINPEEPPCAGHCDHDWRAPHSVVSGIAENPGVWGNGGGVIAREVCAHCGTYRITDTWAQDPDTGEEGLTSVAYADPDHTSLSYVRRRLMRQAMDLLDGKGWLIVPHEDGTGRVVDTDAALIDEDADRLDADLPPGFESYWEGDELRIRVDAEA